MKYTKPFIAVLSTAIIAVGIMTVMPVETKPQPASAAQTEGNCIGKDGENVCNQQPFDPANCQYPDRWSNPVGGCDNSDPAVPECIKAFSTKAGEDACIAEFVAQNNSTPVTTPAPTVPVSQCGGGK